MNRYRSRVGLTEINLLLDFRELLRSFSLVEGTGFICRECGFKSSRQSSMDVHIEVFVHL